MCEPTSTAAFAEWLTTIAAEDAAAGAALTAGEAAAVGTGLAVGDAAIAADAVAGGGVAAAGTQAAALPWGAIASGAQAASGIGTLLMAGKQPAVPAPSQIEKPAAPQAAQTVDAAAVANKRKAQLGQFGNTSTLLTGPSGIDMSTSIIGKSTLLGQ